MKNPFVSAASELVALGDSYLYEEGPALFSAKAAQLLAGARLPELFDFEALVETAFSTSFNTVQSFRALEFSDLPLTIARGDHCFIDVYFWRRRPTVIHNHHFSGAFQCLRGQNVDFTFAFQLQRQLTGLHTLGTLTLLEERLLGPGDIQSIDLFDKFIHQNHHHADLTVNLCFRTSDLRLQNLSNFLFGGLRTEKDTKALARAHRLFACTRIGDFDISRLDLSLEDALNFMTLFHDGTAASPRFQKLKVHLCAMVKAGLDFDVLAALEEHDARMEAIFDTYH